MEQRCGPIFVPRRHGRQYFAELLLRLLLVECQVIAPNNPPVLKNHHQTVMPVIDTASLLVCERNWQRKIELLDRIRKEFQSEIAGLPERGSGTRYTTVTCAQFHGLFKELLLNARGWRNNQSSRLQSIRCASRSKECIRSFHDIFISVNYTCF